MSQTDLIARLENMALPTNCNDEVHYPGNADYDPEFCWPCCRGTGLIENPHAADLRAAAEAVRLVGECQEALRKAKHTSNGWYERTTAALSSITDWEGKHGQ